MPRPPNRTASPSGLRRRECGRGRRGPAAEAAVSPSGDGPAGSHAAPCGGDPGAHARSRMPRMAGNPTLVTSAWISGYSTKWLDWAEGKVAPMASPFGDHPGLRPRPTSRGLLSPSIAGDIDQVEAIAASRIGDRTSVGREGRVGFGDKGRVRQVEVAFIRIVEICHEDIGQAVTIGDEGHSPAGRIPGRRGVHRRGVGQLDRGLAGVYAQHPDIEIFPGVRLVREPHAVRRPGRIPFEGGRTRDLTDLPRRQVEQVEIPTSSRFEAKATCLPSGLIAGSRSSKSPSVSWIGAGSP